MGRETEWMNTENTFTDLPEGSPAFLIESTKGQRSVYYLQSQPGQTNLSGEAKVEGWLGETNNVSQYACGIWQVVGYSVDGQRAKIARVTDRDEIEAFLELVGWPELEVDDAGAWQRYLGGNQCCGFKDCEDCGKGEC